MISLKYPAAFVEEKSPEGISFPAGPSLYFLYSFIISPKVTAGSRRLHHPTA